ncbi:MAG: bifunctional 5,10-methylene-tetrahydrofolate dehydrogenase/5,10-methylene-tetrahydrofolate cyclohydrolase [Oscillospiraceae bacterium]|nr:bifunctional 5,10-methylene-tetrahydrofolate dehydrogenase/5,10-methylene-tetrahydrofolate cyclohydrolase [Oscillospiraceae bacterium]
MAEIWKGAPVVAAMKERMLADTARLRERGVIPTLAILRVGQREDDLAFERTAIKRSGTVGVEVRSVALPEDVDQEILVAQARVLSEDENVHGLLLMRPLPGNLNERMVRRAMRPEKDVDGITGISLAGVFTGSDVGFVPGTAQSVMEILDYYGVDVKGKRVTVVGRSLVVGKPAAMLLLGRHATVTMCHTRTADLPAETRRADILVVAAGKRGIIGAEHVSPGQIVIDVGIHVDENGKLCGDVRFDEVEPIVGAITPVPGGVGTVTTSVMLEHVVRAAKKNVSLD